MIEELYVHHAFDRRCYNGACCSDLQREIDCKKKIEKQLKDNGLNITFFPYGKYYIGFRTHEGKAPDILTEECKSFEDCYYKLLEVVNNVTV